MSSAQSSSNEASGSQNAEQNNPGAAADPLMELLNNTYHFDDIVEPAIDTDVHLPEVPPFGLDLQQLYEQVSAEAEEKYPENAQILSDTELAELNKRLMEEDSKWDMYFPESTLVEHLKKVDNYHFFQRRGNNGKRSISSAQEGEEIELITIDDRPNSRSISEGINQQSSKSNTGGSAEKRMKGITDAEKGTQKQIIVEHRRNERVPIPAGYELGSVTLLNDQQSKNTVTVAPSSVEIVTQVPKRNATVTVPVTPVSSVKQPEAVAPATSTTSKKLNSLNDLMQSEKQKQFQMSRSQYKHATGLTLPDKHDTSRIGQDKGVSTTVDVRAQSSNTQAANKVPPPPNPKQIMSSNPSSSTSSRPNSEGSVATNSNSVQQRKDLILECKYCLDQFFTDQEHDLRIHMLAKHDKECTDAIFKDCIKWLKSMRSCKLCKRMVSSDKLSEHRKKCLPSAPSNDAAFESNEATKLLSRKNPSGSNTIHKCGICQETFELRFQLKMHVDRTHSSITSKMIVNQYFRCAQCLVTEKTAEDLCKHCITCTEQQPRLNTIFSLAKRLLHCDFCKVPHASIRATSKCYMDRGTFRCILCCTVLKEKENITQHMQTYHLSNGNADCPVQNNQSKMYCPVCREGPDKYHRIFPHIVSEHFEPVLSKSHSSSSTNMNSQQQTNGKPNVSNSPITITIASPPVRPPPPSTVPQNPAVVPVVRSRASNPTTRQQLPTLQPLIRSSVPAGNILTSTTPAVTRPRTSLIQPTTSTVNIVTGHNKPTIISRSNNIQPASQPRMVPAPALPQTQITGRMTTSLPTNAVNTAAAAAAATTVTIPKVANNSSVQQIRIPNSVITTASPPSTVAAQCLPTSTIKIAPKPQTTSTIGTATSSPAMRAQAPSSLPISVITKVSTPSLSTPVVVNRPSDPLKTDPPKVSQTVSSNSTIVISGSTLNSNASIQPALTIPTPTTMLAPSGSSPNTILLIRQIGSQNYKVLLPNSPGSGYIKPTAKEVATTSVNSASVSTQIESTVSTSTTNSIPTLASSASFVGTHQSSSGLTAVKHSSTSKYGIPGIQNEICQSLARVLTSKPTVTSPTSTNKTTTTTSTMENK